MPAQQADTDRTFFAGKPHEPQWRAPRLELVVYDEDGTEVERLTMSHAELGQPLDRDLAGDRLWVEVNGHDAYLTKSVHIRRRPDAPSAEEVVRQQMRELGVLPTADKPLPPHWSARLRDVVAQGERLLHGWERWDEDTRQGALAELECRIGELG